MAKAAQASTRCCGQFKKLEGWQTAGLNPKRASVKGLGGPRCAAESVLTPVVAESDARHLPGNAIPGINTKGGPHQRWSQAPPSLSHGRGRSADIYIYISIYIYTYVDITLSPQPFQQFLSHQRVSAIEARVRRNGPSRAGGEKCGRPRARIGEILPKGRFDHEGF